jgi:hypothetical protein
MIMRRPRTLVEQIKTSLNKAGGDALAKMV